MNQTVDPTLRNLNDCGCCEGITEETPVYITNRPGLTAVAYRVGIYTQFKQSMLARLSASDLQALRYLTTRDNDDFTIALLDAWATVADVLTFYQERIANESYLCTATERVSILHLARLIGYELRPGVAASTYLAFTLEDAPGAPRKVTIDMGTKVQSIPGQGEQPQIFETIEKIEARADWNALKPRTMETRIPGLGAIEIYLKGINTGLKPGDGLLFVGEERKNPGSERWDFRRLKSVTANPEGGYTKVIWDKGLGWKGFNKTVMPAQEKLKVYAFRQRASLFGYNAPDWRAMPDNVKKNYIIPPIGSGMGLYAEYFDSIDLTNRKITRIDPKVEFKWNGVSPPNVGPEKFSVRWTGFVQPKSTGVYTFYTWSDDGVRLWVDGKPIIDNWTVHEKKEDSGTIALVAGRIYDIKLEYFQNRGLAVIMLEWSRPDQIREIIPQGQLYPPDFYLQVNEWPDFTIGSGGDLQKGIVHLDAVYSQILPGPGSWLILSIPDHRELYEVEKIAEDSRSNFTLTAKTTRVTLKGKNLDKFNNRLRETVVFAQSELLEIAEEPRTDALEGNSIELDRLVQGLDSGRKLVVSGKRSQPTVKDASVISEMVFLDSDDGKERSTLIFKEKMLNSYDPSSVVIYANIARATHGETVQEVLGSGDASQPYQSFTLRQPPLTYISAPMSSGAESTLQIRINDLLWHEVPSLYSRDYRDRVFVTHTNDDGKTTVQFGDGQMGMRLPTGQENARATYRKGIGQAGNVDADKLNMLMTRQLGVKGVTNPLAAKGGDDRESLNDARQNAPLTVLTLDRIVSLQDYQDFARAFAGIAKALATWAWSGQTRSVFVTVAGPNGAEIRPDSDLYKHLLSAMQKAGDPYIPIRAESYRKALFRIAVRVKLKPDYLSEKVLDEVKNSLRSHFSFNARDFGQPVMLSEIMSVIQAVTGVEAVNVTKLYRYGEKAELNMGLAAAMPQAGTDGTVSAAELLTLDPGPLDDLGVML